MKIYLNYVLAKNEEAKISIEAESLKLRLAKKILIRYLVRTIILHDVHNPRKSIRRVISRVHIFLSK